MSAYEALASGSAFFDLDAWARLRFVGPDAKSFLNGLLTNDVAKLPTRRGFAACLLTPKGRAQAELLLYDCGGPLLALARPAAEANLKSAVGKVLMLSETKLEDLAGTMGLTLLAGPQAPRVVSKALGAVAPREYACATVDGVELCSYPRFSAEAVFILAPADKTKVLRESLQKAGAAAGDEPTLETWRVERGIAAFGRELDEETIPLEARLEEAISYTKGCYMGQETISRVHHMGHVNRLLAALKLAGDVVPTAGAEVFQEGKAVGKVTSACVSPKFGGVLALAMIRAESAKPGTSLAVGAQPTEVIDLGVWA